MYSSFDLCNVKVSSNIDEVIRVIQNLFCRKILQPQNASKRKKVHKQTKKGSIFMSQKTSKKKKVHKLKTSKKKKVTYSLVCFLCSLKGFLCF